MNEQQIYEKNYEKKHLGQNVNALEIVFREAYNTIAKNKLTS